MPRHPTLHELTTEHHHKLTIVKQAREAATAKDDDAPRTALEEVLARFAKEVEPHFVREEKGLVSALGKKGEITIASRITAEHQAIRDMVASAHAHPPRSALALLADALERHVHYEERALIESAQKHLDKTALDAIASATTAS